MSSFPSLTRRRAAAALSYHHQKKRPHQQYLSATVKPRPFSILASTNSNNIGGSCCGVSTTNVSSGGGDNNDSRIPSFLAAPNHQRLHLLHHQQQSLGYQHNHHSRIGALNAAGVVVRPYVTTTTSDATPPLRRLNHHHQDSHLRVLPWPGTDMPSWRQHVNEAWIQFFANSKLPKGFENFFPKHGPAKPSDGETTTSDSNKDGAADESKGASSSFASSDAKQDKNKKDKKKKQQSTPPPPNNNDDNNNNNDTANIPGLLLMLAMIVAFRQFLESDKNSLSKGKEVTFQEFRRDYLLKGKVDYIQVVNKSVAKVYLKDAAGSSSSAAALDDDESHSSDAAASSNTAPTSSELYSTGGGVQGGDVLLDGSGNSNKTDAKYIYFFVGSVETLEEKLTKAQANWHPADWVDVHYISQTNWGLEAFKLLPLLALMASLYYGTRMLSNSLGGGGFGGGRGGGGGGPGGIFGIGKSNAKKISPSDVQVDFGDVAGCQQAKLEVMEFVDFLKHPARFQKLGAKIPKGALLCGPPGTGKTLLAKAVAGEAGVPFYSISGSDFIEMFVGVGPSRVRDLFKEARQNSPCIVFIDEVDAVGRQRGRGGFSGGNDERENTLNQLLVEMDGFSPTTNIVVLAGTNRADILDQALTRPGRFDRQITVDLPDLQGRKEIFMVHLKGITLEQKTGTTKNDGGDNTNDENDTSDDDDEDQQQKEAMESYAGRLAGLTPGFSGASIANLCNEAAIVAARRKAEAVTMDDFEKATDRIIGGLESNKIMSDQEKDIVAHHEAGHAVAGWFLEHADPLLKVTIIPRTSGALGFAQYLPKEVFLRSREQIMDIVCMALAGRAAEQVFFGQVTTGASDDLRRVTQLVYSTIKDFGMNPRLGQLAFPNDGGDKNPGDKPYSESTAEAMDEEARAIVEEAYQRTLALITERKEEVGKVAQLLRDKETITHDDIVDLIGKRPYGDKAYDEYVSSRAAINNDNDKLVGDDDDSTTEKDDEEDKNDTTLGDGPTLTPGLA